MKKIIVLLTAIMLLLSACSSATLDGAGKELEDTIANATDADNKYVQMVKGGYRTDDPNVTYETAFSSFFGTPRWKYFKSDNEQDVVEFTGDCVYRDASVKARIQFVVDEENGTFEATYLAFNEVPQDALTLSALISKAFEEAKAASNGSGSTSTENQILISGIPAQDIFRLSVDEIIATFGAPDMQSSTLIQYKIRDEVESTFYDDGWMSFELESEGQTSKIRTDPANVTFNDQNLGIDSESVIAILGEDYEIVETTGYSWIAAWDYGDYQISFEFPRDFGDTEGNAEAFAVVVNRGQSAPDDYATIPKDEGLSEGGSVHVTRDSELVGRWRSYDGNALTFEDTGYATKYFKFWSTVTNPDYVTWEASDNCLMLSAHWSLESEWQLSTAFHMVKAMEVDVLNLDNLGGEYWREKTGSNDLAGTWNYTGDVGGDLILYSDGTGTKASRPIVWWVDGNIFHCDVTETHSYDYTVSWDTLTVFFTDGSRLYTKIS